jgi:hypothetical protein
LVQEGPDGLENNFDGRVKPFPAGIPEPGQIKGNGVEAIIF